MDVLLTFTIAGAVILLGFLGEWIFDKTSIPDPIWLMAFGVIINQTYVLSSNTMIVEVGALFAVFAMIFILFEGVMNTDLKSLFLGFMRGSEMAVIHFLLTVIVVTASMRILGWGWLESILLGIILSDAAQTVIIPLIKRISLGKDSAAALTFESAFTDVLCIIGSVTVLNMMVLESISLSAISKDLLYSFIVGLVLGAVGGFIWINIHKLMNKFNKSYITTIAAMLLLYCGVEYVDANGALACLAFGIVVANSKLIFGLLRKHDDETPSVEKFFYSEISFFVKSFFFVYLGMMINLKETGLILVGLLLAILILLVRPISVALSGIRSKVPDKDRIYIELLNPKGTSAAVLALLPLQYGISYAYEMSMIIPAVIAFSILFCVILVFLTSKNLFPGFGELLDLRKVFRKKS